jgi:hypothetical protein
METVTNPTWHDELEGARSVDEAVASVRRYLGTLSLHDLDRLPRYCDPRKIRSDDDVDDLTFKLAQLQREVDAVAQRTVAEVFGFVLHASLRISRLNRQRVQNVPGTPHTAWGVAARQMH